MFRNIAGTFRNYVWEDHWKVQELCVGEFQECSGMFQEHSGIKDHWNAQECFRDVQGCFRNIQELCMGGLPECSGMFQQCSGIISGRIPGMFRNVSGTFRNYAWEDYWNVAKWWLANFCQSYCLISGIKYWPASLVVLPAIKDLIMLNNAWSEYPWFPDESG